MLSYNCMQKGSNMAHRGGDLHRAQAIMKGFKRGMKKNITTNVQAQAYKDNCMLQGSVYAKMGNEIHELDAQEE